MSTAAEPTTTTTNVVALRPRAAGGSDERDAGLGVLAPLLIGLIALTALDGGLYDYARWGLLAAVMLAVLAGLLIAGRVGSFGSLTPALLALIGVTVWASASILWADSPDRAWTESNRLVLYTAVFAICVVILRTPRDLRRALAIIGVVIAAAAVWTVVALLRGDPGAFLDHRLDTPIGYINGTAGLFLIGLWPLISVAERDDNPRLAGAAMALAVVEANLLVLTQSRAVVPAVLLSAIVLLILYPGRAARLWTLLAAATGTVAASHWTFAIYADRIPRQARAVPDDLAQGAAIAILVTATIAGLVWFAVTALRRAWNSPWARRLAVVGAVGAVVCATVIGLVASGDVPQRVQREWQAFTSLDTTRNSSTRFTGAGGFRFDLWRVAVDDLQREPLLGVGAGSYGLSYYQQRAQDESIRQPHSLPLQVLAELGIVGGVLALIAFVSIATSIVRNRHADVTAGVAGVGMAASWGTQTSLDWLYNLPGITCIAIVGMVAATGARPFAALAGDRRRRVVLIGGALLIAICAASFGRHYSAQRYAERAQKALPGDPAAALARARTSLQLNPYAVETRYTQAAAHALRDDYARARESLMRAAAQEPLNFVPWALIGDLAARRGEIAQARSAYRRASKLNPRDVQLAEIAAHPRRALP